MHRGASRPLQIGAGPNRSLFSDASLPVSFFLQLLRQEIALFRSFKFHAYSQAEILSTYSVGECFSLSHLSFIIHYRFRRRSLLQHPSPLYLLSRGDADGPVPLRVLSIIILENSPLIKIVRPVTHIIRVYKHPITRHSLHRKWPQNTITLLCLVIHAIPSCEQSTREGAQLYYSSIQLHSTSAVHMIPPQWTYFCPLRACANGAGGVIMYLRCVGNVGCGAGG